MIYRASRLEALLDPLLALMDSAPPEHVLQPHSVIAAHPGMKQWLTRAMARRRGPGGIAANIDIVLPSVWLDRLAKHVLGEDAISLRPYRRETLRWRIHDLLGHSEDPQVNAYLRGDEVPRRCFPLADRLAKIYSQYLVYRNDWLLAWARGDSGPADSGLLAALWRELRTNIGQPHRGERLRQLIARLGDDQRALAASEPLHVFGVSHLAPSELAVLRAVAAHRMVVLYVPDPCREFWGGLRGDRRHLLDLLKQTPDGVDQADVTNEIATTFLDQDHPLLASWGRLGQHFMLSLADGDARIDERHWQDRTDTPLLETRLQRVQESVRQLAPALIAGNEPDSRADRSLRIHACHTRLRELEVLRDALLRERVENPQLKPSDILVTMPNVQAYLPLLPAVFGEPGRHGGTLPWHLADVSVASTHPLFSAFRQLLDLPQSRISAPEVIDLLKTAPIARRFGISEGDLDVIAGWLQNARVAWGLDGPFRQRFDAPPISEHTFAWAMDRMLTGYVMGDGGDDEMIVELPDDTSIAPVQGFHGPQAALLGTLDRVLVELATWCREAAQNRPASEWAALLEQRFEAMFQIDPTDSDARDPRSQLLGFIRAIASEPADSGLDPALDFSVVRDVLLGNLAAVSDRQAFLIGGMTVCGMVPQRAVPFRVIAVLGLNDGEYPRADADGGLDLMLKHPRLGDRGQRSDDRYLFLETLMSARDTLHLSYIGEGVRDAKPRNPATPLAELMTVFDQAAGLSHDADNTKRPWLIRHPLQAFDDRYFNASDEALFSFRADLANLRIGDKAKRSASFVRDDDLPVSADAAFSEEDGLISLRNLLGYFRDPAKQLLESELQLRLDALSDDRLRDSEPLEDKAEALDTIAKREFLRAAERGEAPSDAAPAYLRLHGWLPPGRAGQGAWTCEKDKVNKLLAAFADHELFRHGLPDASPQSIDVMVGSHRVQGEIANVHVRDGTLCLLDVVPGKNEAALDFKLTIGVFIKWSLLRLSDSAGLQAVRVCVVTENPDGSVTGAYADWDARFLAAIKDGESEIANAMLDDLRRRLDGLTAFWKQSVIVPRWYFPKTSSVADRLQPQAASGVWIGGHSIGERDYSPGYARMLAGDREFDEGEDFEQLCVNAEHLRVLIDLQVSSEAAL
ncbi:MAG: exodeoxyribonuclease V subunit gamma [Dokdonella sp.]